MSARKFAPGVMTSTPGALAALTPERLVQVLQLHLSGDWGAVCAEDRQTNDAALLHGARLLSVYPIDPTRPAEDDNCVWVITEADRSATTVLLPEEY